jgi:hypothetical protein
MDEIKPEILTLEDYSDLGAIATLGFMTSYFH